MFTLANSIAISMYIIGFCESLMDMLRAYTSNFTGIIDNGVNDVRIIGSCMLVVILVLAIVGMKWITRVQKLLLVLLVFSQLDFVIGCFFVMGPSEEAKGFTGWSYQTAEQNLGPQYQDETFWSVFSVFFPAVTGIVAGANMSGDLKDPASAIPNGTFGAIALTYVTYIIYGIFIGCTYLPDASGSVKELVYTFNGTSEYEDEKLLSYTECDISLRNVSCEYGSKNDQQTMTIISVTGYLIYFGCFAATLSSAIASLIGAPRVLQALAKDKLFPKVEFFAKGYGPNSDPVRGYVLVFTIALICVLIGDLNVVSSLLSNFFVASYALINFSAFHASLIKSPGWRPTFKLYNPWVSLVGTFLCLAVMFLMDWITAIVTFCCILILYLFIYYRKPEANWGSSTQAQVFVNALKSVQTLTDTPDHVKNFRPKLLILSGNPTHRIPLIDFGNLLTKKLSILICSQVITENKPKNLRKMKEETQTWMKKQKVQGFFDVVQSSTFDEGANSILTLSGLGRLCPNMVLLGFKSDWDKNWEGSLMYLKTITKAYQDQMAVLLLRVRGGLDFSNQIVEEELIEPEDLEEPGEVVRKKKKPVLDRKISVEQGGKKKISTDRAQVSKLGMAINSLVMGASFQPRDVLSDIKQFQDRKRRGNIDIWWLYDDGGLPVFLSHILHSRQQFSECKLRVFTLGSDKKQVNLFSVFTKNIAAKMETKNMEETLHNFRINTSDVTVVPDINPVSEKSWNLFTSSLKELPKEVVGTKDIIADDEFIRKHLRVGDMLQKYSRDAQIILMTLPQQKLGRTNPAIYMSCLDLMTRNLPPLLLIGGNNTSVLTSFT